jgi:hypothetical protein
MKSSFCPAFSLQVAISRALAFVLEISLFGSIDVNIVEKVFHIWHSDPYMDRLHPSRESKKGVMAEKKQFSNTKSILKVETGIVTLISYHHYLKIVGNNKL